MALSMCRSVRKTKLIVFSKQSKRMITLKLKGRRRKREEVQAPERAVKVEKAKGPMNDLLKV